MSIHRISVVNNALSCDICMRQRHSSAGRTIGIVVLVLALTVDATGRFPVQHCEAKSVASTTAMRLQVQRSLCMLIFYE